MDNQLKIKHPKDLCVRFAGDSGDGVQLLGAQFTLNTALTGSDIHTMPDFPAEIRAPTGTLAGVSGFQIHLAEYAIHTSGDRVDVLVAMNPAALKMNLADLIPGGLLIVNSDHFQAKDLAKAGYEKNPLESEALQSFQVLSVPATDLTVKALADFSLSHSQAKKCKNFYMLGIILWLFDRDVNAAAKEITRKFKSDPTVSDASQAALKAGYNYALTLEIARGEYHVGKMAWPEGDYRQITGTQAIALACVVAAKDNKFPLLVSGYPITPASAILQHAAHYARFGLHVFQAEDEIAAVCAAVGAAFGGALALTCTSGPGMDLKSEGLGLAVMTELPLVLVDMQRAGPSTGMPTKTEQSDLLTALYGRHGECPLPILAAKSPADCFDCVLSAFQIAIKYMTPVIVLCDANLGNSAEPWRIPALADLPTIKAHYREPTNDAAKENSSFYPYQRDEITLARPWAIPGTPNLEHRIGGLEKNNLTGNVSYDPDNHQQMVQLRAEKIAKINLQYSPLEILGDSKASILIISWGSTYGSVLTAVEELQQENVAVAMVHLRHLNPLPQELADIIKRYPTVLVPELNSGQLAKVLRAQYLVDVITLNKITGKPFLVSEIKEKVLSLKE